MTVPEHNAASEAATVKERRSAAAKADKPFQRRDEILAAARAKAADVLREVRGVTSQSEPAPRQSVPTISQDPVKSAALATGPQQPGKKEAPAAKAEAKPEAPPPADDGKLAQMLADQLQQQFAQGAKEKAEAARLKAEAAEQLRQAQAILENPVEYLAKTGKSIDEWNAQLANGGKETPEQLAVRKANEAASRAEKVAHQLQQQLNEQKEQMQRQETLRVLTPAIEAEYPLVNRLVGPDKALELLRHEQKLEVQNAQLQGRAPQQLQARDVLSKLEERLLGEFSGLLKDAKITGKYALSAPQPKTEPAEEPPRTMTNRVTSTTGPGFMGRTSLEEKRLKAAEALAAFTRG